LIEILERNLESADEKTTLQMAKNIPGLPGLQGHKRLMAEAGKDNLK